MLPHTHLLMGLLVGLWLYDKSAAGIWSVFLICILSVLIDLDHLADFFIKFRSWSPVTFWNACMAEKVRRSRLHSVTGFFLVIALSAVVFFLWNALGIILLASYVPHMLLDLLHAQFPEHELIFRIKGMAFRILYAEIMLDALFIVLLFL